MPDTVPRPVPALHPDECTLQSIADLLDRASDTDTSTAVEMAFEHADAARFISDDFAAITESWTGSAAELDHLRAFVAAFGWTRPDPTLTNQEWNTPVNDLHTDDIVEFDATYLNEPMLYDMTSWLDDKMVSLQAMVGQLMFDPYAQVTVHGDVNMGSITVLEDGTSKSYEWKTVRVPVAELAAMTVHGRDTGEPVAES